MQSHDRTLLINNTIALGKVAKTFGVPTLLTTIIEDLGAQVLEPDGMDFETSRGVLITASHDVRGLGGPRDPIGLGTELWP